MALRDNDQPYPPVAVPLDQSLVAALPPVRRVLKPSAAQGGDKSL